MKQLALLALLFSCLSVAHADSADDVKASMAERLALARNTPYRFSYRTTSRRYLPESWTTGTQHAGTVRVSDPRIRNFVNGQRVSNREETVSVDEHGRPYEDIPGDVTIFSAGNRRLVDIITTRPVQGHSSPTVVERLAIAFDGHDSRILHRTEWNGTKQVAGKTVKGTDRTTPIDTVTLEDLYTLRHPLTEYRQTSVTETRSRLERNADVAEVDRVTGRKTFERYDRMGVSVLYEFSGNRQALGLSLPESVTLTETSNGAPFRGKQMTDFVLEALSPEDTTKSLTLEFPPETRFNVDFGVIANY